LAITRSGHQIPFRIDFAIPLVHHHGAQPFDISTGSGQAFEPFGNAFASQGNETRTDF
jgi:hypothetical protein